MCVYASWHCHNNSLGKPIWKCFFSGCSLWIVVYQLTRIEPLSNSLSCALKSIWLHNECIASTWKTDKLYCSTIAAHGVCCIDTSFKWCVRKCGFKANTTNNQKHCSLHLTCLRAFLFAILSFNLSLTHSSTFVKIIVADLISQHRQTYAHTFTVQFNPFMNG